MLSMYTRAMWVCYWQTGLFCFQMVYLWIPQLTPLNLVDDTDRPNTIGERRETHTLLQSIILRLNIALNLK